MKKDKWSVKYKLHGDGLAPTSTPFGAVLRIPLPVGPLPVSHSDDSRVISLGVSFDVPVYVEPVVGFGVKSVLYGPIIRAGEPVRISVADNASIDSKAVVANVFFFSPPELVAD